MALGAQVQSLATTRGAGPSDTLLFTRIAWSEPDAPPHRLATFVLQLTVPTGDVDRSLGNGVWIVTGGSSFTLYRKPFVWHLDVLGALPVPDEAGRHQRADLLWALAVEAPLPFLNNSIAGVLELTGRHEGWPLDAILAPEAGVAEQEIVLGVGVEVIASDTFQALVGWQRTLYGRNVDAVDTIVVTLVPLL